MPANHGNSTDLFRGVIAAEFPYIKARHVEFLVMRNDTGI